MRPLTPGVTYPVPFSTSTEPDELPTATVYAGATSLGAATVTAASGVNECSVAVALPSEGLTNGTPIYVKINWAVGGEAQSTVTLLAGVVNLHAVQAAAVLSAAAVSPIHADVRAVDEAAGVAKEDSVLAVLGAVEAVSFGAVIVPMLGQIQSRTEGTTIRVFTRETTTLTLAVVNAIGQPVDLAGMTLSLVIERAKGGDISVIDDDEITKVGSSISFSIPAEVSQFEGYHAWALRSSDGAVLMQGPLVVEYAPEVDQ